MPKTKLGVIAPILVALCSSLLCADQPEQKVVFKSPDARSAVRDFAAAEKKLNEFYANALLNMAEKYRTEMKKLRDTLVSKLIAAQDDATKAADLDEAIKLRKAIESYSALPCDPARRHSSISELSAPRKHIAEMEKEVATLRAIARKVEARQPKTAIPTNAAKFRGHSYMIYSGPATVNTASRFCQKLGGYLARVESAEEQQFLVQLLSRQSPQARAYWIDGSDEEVEGAWTYSNGERMIVGFFHPNEPNNADDKEHHIAMMSQHRYVWIDAIGGERLAFICEWDN